MELVKWNMKSNSLLILNKNKNKMKTFSEYIIQKRSKNFYFVSLGQMTRCKTTLEEWFRDMYTDYKIQHLTDNVKHVDNLKLELDKLSDDERYALLSEYCKYCGSKDTGCVCQNDI
jgi:hypothetical protein